MYYQTNCRNSNDFRIPQLVINDFAERRNARKMGMTAQIADFVEQLQYDNLPDDVIESAKKCILDFFGCALFATQTDMGKIITKYCKEGNSGYASIFPDFEGKYNPANAALANGTLAHGFELDDINTISISHPGSVVISAAMAIGEDRGIDGKRLIEAVVAGYDVMSRVGSTIAAAHIAKGFHPTGSFGVFGATAAACKILGLNNKQIENAFGIAGSMASGLTQFSINGSMVKRIHAGKSAQQGVIVSQLAEKGFTGPADIFEGDLGFCRTFRGDESMEIKWERLTDKLGEKYCIAETTFKPSAACGVLHAVVEALENCRKNPLFDIDKIEKIIVGGSKNSAFGHNVYEPESILSAQYSLPFTVGVALTRDIQDPSFYLDNSILKDQRILSLGRKVTTYLDDEIEAIFPDKFGAKVEVVLTDGTILSDKILSPKGSSSNPFSFDELQNKYYKLAKTVLPEKNAAAISQKIKQIENSNNIRKMFVNN